MSESLHTVLLRAISPELRSDFDGPLLAETLSAYVRRAQNAWPGLQLDLQKFVLFMGERVNGKALPEPAAEMYLIYGCLEGSPAALRCFDEEYLSDVDRVLSRSNVSPPDLEDIRATIRARLLVAPRGERPAIARYAGRGDLHALIRVAATREALTLKRDTAREVHDVESAVQNRISDLDPEILYWKTRHHAQLKNAFEGALRGLAPRTRLLLRLHIVEGLTIDQVGDLFHVHRATAARWLDSAREEVADRARGELSKELGLDETNIQSLMRFIRSQADLSISRLLRSDGAQVAGVSQGGREAHGDRASKPHDFHR